MDTTDNISFIGSSGVRKTQLAISIALEAKAKERSCSFALSNELIDNHYDEYPIISMGKGFLKK